MAFYPLYDINAAIHGFLPVLEKHWTTLATVASLGACLLAWRFVVFIVLPSLRSDEPEQLPYWIPSHLFEFFGNSDALLSRARDYFGNTREPFALTILGMKTYVLTKGADVTEVYRNTQTLSYEEFVRNMMRLLGNSDFAVRTMFRPLPKDKDGFPNPHGKAMGMLFREMHIRQLFPGPNLEFLEDAFGAFFDSNLALKTITAASYAVADTSGAGGVVVPLVRWCSDYFVRAGQDAYFGPKLGEINEYLTDDFLAFDELSYQVIYQYPHLLARELQASRRRIIEAFKQYIQLPLEERQDAAWFVGACEAELGALGLSTDDIAIAIMTIYWAINTNTRKAAFWLLAYLVETPSLISVIRRETAPAFRHDGSVDAEYLHTSTPQLDAMWSEMLRLSSFAASVRYIMDDTIIGGKKLRGGNRLIVPYRQLHMNPDVFGDDMHGFHHERFLERPRLAQGANFRPFGGGSTACPGHYIAKRSVVLFTATVLRRFDIEMLPGQKMLRADLSKPVPGIMSAKPGEDMLVRLTPRNV